MPEQVVSVETTCTTIAVANRQDLTHDLRKTLIPIFENFVRLAPEHWGALAALAAAVCWAASSMLFRSAGMQIQPILLNLYKGIISAALLSVGLLCFPPDASISWPTAWLLLVSGAIGIGIGDTAFFSALNQLGERQALLLTETIAPPMTLCIGFIVLSESFSPMGIFGIFITLAGVAWVLSERASSASPQREQASPKEQVGLVAFLRRYGMALLAAACQSLGAIISRYALTQSDVDPYTSSLLRLFGGIAILAIYVLAWRVPVLPRPVRDLRVWRVLCLATLIGTLLGIVLQQTALQLASAAIAQTLIATSVLFVLPMLFFRGQTVSWRAWMGALVAIAGVALIFAA